MKTGLTRNQRISITVFCFAIAVIGFMLKLPATFRHMDKELHAAFYFGAAAFLNVLFVNTKLIRHLIVFAVLYLFGAAIEFGQAYSNKFFRKRIHGRFDPEDLQWNLKGLVAFSLLWLVYVGGVFIYRRLSTKSTTQGSTTR